MTNSQLIAVVAFVPVAIYFLLLLWEVSRVAKWSRRASEELAELNASLSSAKPKSDTPNWTKP